MFIILLILIFIRPFISSLAFPFLNSLYSNFFLLFIITWLFVKGASLNKIQTLKYPLISFCLALIISVAFSSDKVNSLEELSYYITGLFLFAIGGSLTYEEKIRLIQTIILASFVIGLLSIYQYFFGFQHILEYIHKQKLSDPFVLDYIIRKRVFFPFVTPNTLAGYLIMIIPLLLINKNRIWFIIPLSFALLLTQSLGAFLSLFLVLGIYFYLKNKLEMKGIFFLFGLLIIIGLVFIARVSTQKQHLQPIFSTVMRLSYWKDALRMIGARPLIGVGLGNFNLVQSRYAHNSYLQIWAEMGILGIASIIWLIIVVFKSALKNIKASLNKNLIISLFAANAAFLIHNLVDFSFFLPEVSLIWWVMLGLLYANCTLADKEIGEI
jgi:O-antigen ligase